MDERPACTKRMPMSSTSSMRALWMKSTVALRTTMSPPSSPKLWANGMALSRQYSVMATSMYIR